MTDATDTFAIPYVTPDDALGDLPDVDVAKAGRLDKLLPWRGSTAVDIVNDSSAHVDIAFPGGHFDAPPLVFLQTVNTAIWRASPSNITPGGCRITVYNISGNNVTATVGVFYQALAAL